jgi:hypothetical protein
MASCPNSVSRSVKPPSASTWCEDLARLRRAGGAFLRNEAIGIAAIDMFVVASATFRLLFVTLILAHDRRKIVRFDVTQHPTAGWLSRQVTEAFPWDTAPRYLLRDRERVYSELLIFRHKSAIRHTQVRPLCGSRPLGTYYAVLKSRSASPRSA